MIPDSVQRYDGAHTVWVDSVSALREYQYLRPVQQEPSWFERVLKELGKLLGGATEATLDNIPMSIWILIGIVMLIVVAVLFNMKRIAAGEGTSIRATATVEDMASDQLAEHLADDIAHGRWRSAVRYLYLQSLDELQRREYIVWRRNSTNAEYLRQVAETPVVEHLRNVTNVYEQVWYGERPISEEEFMAARAGFDDLHTALGRTA